MNIKEFLLLAVLVLLSKQQLEAQVTIGSGLPPIDVAILQIDGKEKGLRLSRLMSSERDALAVSGSAAKGLLIYNIDYNCLEFWDGNNWKRVGNPYKYQNGLTLNNSNVKLGGTLEQNTVIGQKAHGMKFITTSGSLAVNTDALYIDDQSLSMKNITNFTLKDNAGDNTLAITNTKDIAINTKLSDFNVNNGLFKVTGNGVEIKGKLQYKEGNESASATKTQVLFSDAGGNANWKELLPSTSTKNIAIARASGTPSGPAASKFTVNTWTSITDNFTLETGKWLVIGRFTSYTSGKTNSTIAAERNYLSMIRLYDITSSKEIYVSARLPESKSYGGAENSGAYAAPMMIAYVDVPPNSNYRIDFKTSKSNTWYTTHSFLGTSYFTAIRMND